VCDVREAPRSIREAICDVLGFESANRGLKSDESLNDYGRELEALIAAPGLDGAPQDHLFAADSPSC